MRVFKKMVSEIEHAGDRFFIYDQHGNGYKDRRTAERCENWCSTHQSCSIKIMKDAVYISEH